ncbi:MAG TPA: FG-GAP-like repeat-containing protein, partial [Thermoanaerobaculia bacterium]|nr:FG-GAP-like repeat-containing protein [Thermoanaerobaculia bacterium]
MRPLTVSPPVVTKISPMFGPAAGGTVVTITGSNFIVGATTLKFGATAGTSVSCASTTQCTATSPAGSGTVSVRVATAWGTSADTAADDFTYTAPATACTVFSPATNFSAGSAPYSVAIGDFTGDGKSDLAVADSFSNNVLILLGTGTGTFGAATNFSVGTIPFSVAIGDFNGDGKSDLAVANEHSNNVSILLGTGTGTFGAATTLTTGSIPLSMFSVAIGDFN